MNLLVACWWLTPPVVLDENLDVVEWTFLLSDLFIDEVRIVPSPRGDDVFERESDAVKELEKALKDKKIKDSSKSIIEGVIADLVEADRQIAELAIQNAEMLVDIGQGDSKDLEKFH